MNIEEPGALERYLRDRGWVLESESLTVQPLPGGVSNRTVMVERGRGRAWVAKQALDRLRVEVEWYCSPKRISAEASGIRWLGRILGLDRVAPLVFEDPNHHLLVMEAIPRPHDNWKQLLLGGRLDPGHVSQFGQMLAQIHRGGWKNLSELAADFADWSSFEALRLEPYYEYSARQVPETAPFLERLVETTRARRDTLVHGDYSPKNVLVRGDDLVLIDHEVIHIGDPGFDLGFSLTHLLSKAHHLPPHRAAFADAALLYWRTYREALGEVPWEADLEVRAVNHTLGCLLSRVVGRSLLEYLGQAQRTRQTEVVASLMDAPPVTVEPLIGSFIGNL